MSYKNTEKNKAYQRAYNKRWNAKNKDKIRDAHLRNKYGISLQEQNALLIVQEGKCCICHRLLTEPCVDHDHTTGKVRGLLCWSCNMLLGQCNDDLDILYSAIHYLERNK